MGIKKTDLKKILNWLGFVLKCPVCSAKYQSPNIKILDSFQEDQMQNAHLLIHSDCHKCKSSVMFNIDINGSDIFTIIAKTDLNKRDSKKFSALPAINTNDLIKIHEQITGFDGDFISAFGKK